MPDSWGSSDVLTFGSLFAGIGGFDLGLERAGLRCEWQVEIDGYCQRVLEKHWPGVRRWSDARTFPGPDGQWGVDLICGGDPCQANSKAGRSTKESLGGEFVRIVDALRPRLVVRENPTGVRTDAPWPWWRFRSNLESLGYAVLPFRLRTCCVGGEHQRDRLFLFAELLHSDSERLAWRHSLSECEMQSSSIQTPAQDFDWPHIPRSSGYGSRHGIPGGVDRLKCLGNAVVPQVAEWIGRRIVEWENRRESVRPTT